MYRTPNTKRFKHNILQSKCSVWNSWHFDVYQPSIDHNETNRQDMHKRMNIIIVYITNKHVTFNKGIWFFEKFSAHQSVKFDSLFSQNAMSVWVCVWFLFSSETPFQAQHMCSHMNSERRTNPRVLSIELLAFYLRFSAQCACLMIRNVDGFRMIFIWHRYLTSDTRRNIWCFRHSLTAMLT